MTLIEFLKDWLLADSAISSNENTIKENIYHVFCREEVTREEIEECLHKDIKDIEHAGIKQLIKTLDSAGGFDINGAEFYSNSKDTCVVIKKCDYGKCRIINITNGGHATNIINDSEVKSVVRDLEKISYLSFLKQGIIGMYYEHLLV